MPEVVPTRHRRDDDRRRIRPVPPAPPPPPNLSERAAGIWAAVCRQWVIGDDGAPLLRCSLEALDRHDAAVAVLAVEGLTITGPSGLPRTHPASRVAHEALNDFRSLWRQLGLEPWKV